MHHMTDDLVARKQYVDFRHKQPVSPSAAAKRCFSTVLVRGTGSYIARFHKTKPNRPNYVASAIPLLCSFRRAGSAYPFVILAVNLTGAEHDALRVQGGLVVNITQPANKLRFELPHGVPSCKPKGAGAWQVWGRSDFAETMIKTLLWKTLAELGYDEVAYVDADSIFLSRPDVIFDALRPQELGRQSRAHRILSLRDLARCRTPGRPHHGSQHRRLCPSLQFAASFSSRLDIMKTTTELANHTLCQQPGWQSGFFVTRPSLSTFWSLQRRARDGNFTLFTQTEQDVLDAEFPVSEQCVGVGLPKQPSCTRHAYMSHMLVQSLVMHHKIHAYDGNALLSTALIHNLSLTFCTGENGTSRRHLRRHLPATVPIIGLPRCESGCYEMNMLLRIGRAFNATRTDW